jgi:hypothetical protein
MSFDSISKCQFIVNQEKQRDKLMLKIELKDEVRDRDSLANDLNTKFQSVCRLKIDKIDFAERGTFPETYQTIVDERSWE